MQFNLFPSLIHIWCIVFVFLIIENSSTTANDKDIEKRLQAELLALGFPNGQLPTLVPALGNYVDVVEVNKLLFLSSAAPQTPQGTFVKGRVPNEVSVADAITASKLACARQVNRMKTYLGDLSKVKKIVFINGKVQSQSDFTNHTVVVDGCSTFLVNVFGEKVGKHARTSGGLTSLPFNVTIEVEIIVQRK
ncbi:unnamed protein product [Adineta ricciae]|uniref:Endoribonuclease L-PSP/chorismate mutase-like domain-containing protein n=2 Tax=Adineta ricciae TaxID=249248 RepID=A0A814V514_ADIRI|nr:unnamed protein product [Adineta ricciae]